MPEALATVATQRTAGITALKRVAILPALNEEECIARVIEEIRAYDPGFEIVVVDDGSTDSTARVAAAHGARVLRLPFNLGIGGAVQTGYRYAYERGFDLAVQIDGDGQHDPNELPRILAPIVADEADVVIGSRFAGLGSYQAPRVHRLGMRIFASVVSRVVGQPLTDTSSAFRATNRRGLFVFSADYPHGYLETVEATVLAAKSGLRLLEVPVSMRDRAAGRSSLTFGRSVFYATKVLVAVFVGLFRGTRIHIEEER